MPTVVASPPPSVAVEIAPPAPATAPLSAAPPLTPRFSFSAEDVPVPPPAVVTAAPPTVATAAQQPTPQSPANVADVASGSTGRTSPALMLWGVGILSGILVSLLLSAFKPGLGRGGLVLIAGTIGLCTTILAVAFVVFRWCEQSFQGEPLQAFARLRSRAGSALQVFSGMAALCAILAIAEWFGPSEGFFRRATDGGPSERAEAPPRRSIEPGETPTQRVVLKPSTADFTNWSGADFLVVNPSHRAVGIRNRGQLGKPEYELVAKAADDQVVGIKKYAWNNKIPIYAGDPALARRLFEEFNVGQTVVGNRRDELSDTFRPKTFVPVSGQFVSYFDTVNNLKRVGHLIQDQGDAFVFADLLPHRLDAVALKGLGSDALPFRTEVIRRSERVQRGTEQRNLNDISLRDSTDFVEYCIYGALSKLQASQSAASSERDRITPFIYVQVNAEVKAQEYASMKLEFAEAREELRRDLRDALNHEQTPMGLLNLLNRHLSERQRYVGRMNSQSNLRKQVEGDMQSLRLDIKKLERLAEVEATLASEIRRAFLRAGIKVVERSDRAREIICNKVSGNRWIRADATTAADTNMVDATHILMTSISKSQKPGKYMLIMQLVNPYDGTIMWEEVGNREDREPDGQPVSLETAASLPSRSDLQGVWSTPGGVQLEISEADQTVRARLVSSTVLDAFDLVATRNGSAISVSSCTVKIKLDPLAASRPVRADLTILDANRLRIGCDTIQIDRRGREIGRTYHTFELVRKES